MINPPKTLEKAKKYKYEQWAGNPNGTGYKKENCAYELSDGWLHYQCSRKNGYGSEKLYCKQHAKIINDNR